MPGGPAPLLGRDPPGQAQGTEQFYVRTGNGSSQLGMREAFRYIRHRWGP